MSLEDTMRQIQQESEASDWRLAAAQLRKFLAGALCAHCGEPLGEGVEVVQDDDERTMHASCLSDAQGEEKDKP